jgi:hypothetical protein
VRSCVSQKQRAEVVGREFRDVAFDQNLGFAIRRERVERGVFGQQVVAARQSIGGARRREQEPLNPGFPGLFRQPNRCQVIDVVGALWIQVAERIVGDRGKVDNRVEPPQI